MKKYLKKIAAAIIGAAMCLSLCACSADLDTVMLMAKVADVVKNTSSVDADITAKAKASYGILPIKFTVNADMKCILDPMQAELEADIDLGLLGDIEFEAYAVANGSKIDVYYGFEDILGTMSWNHMSVAVPAGTTLDTDGILAMLQGESKLVTRGEDMQIGGVDAAQFIVTIPGEMISNGENQVGSLAVTVWVSKDSGRILRAEAELSELAYSILSSAFGEKVSKVKIESLPMVMVIDSYNTVSSINVPSAAIKAA